jgi:predicted enzyme related to lactoylglutathione lyase
MSERNGYPPGVPCWVDTWQPDADAAARFYAHVFGWDIEGPAGGPYMCKLRGRDVAFIGERPRAQAHLPVAWTSAVSRRSRFSRDVVAGMAAMNDFPEGTPPHWRIDFWVDNVDTTVGRAAELDGRAVVPPYDTPISRQAVLADPQGAVFSVSQVPGGREAPDIDNPSRPNAPA